MTEEIKQAIAQTLKNSYPDRDVYTEEMTSQGKKNCFFVDVSHMEWTRKIGHGSAKIWFEVRYLAGRGIEEKEDLQKTGSQMLKTLDQLELEGRTLRCREHSLKLDQGRAIVNFWVELWTGKQQPDVETMKKYTLKWEEKWGGTEG